MPDVSPNTLVMCVQAVQSAIVALETRLKDPKDDARDDTEMLLAYSRAADELREAYELARRTTMNMPPYDKLVPPGET